MNYHTLVIFGLAILCASMIASSPVSAAFLVNGTLYYADLPKNDLYEKTVMPGDTIALGRTYDLTYVSGVTKKYAWWKDTSIEGTTCTPDTIIETSYIDTNGKIRPNTVTLDPADGWKPGNWWQWDGCYQMKFQRNHPEPQYSVYLQDNNLMFHVIYDPHPLTPVPTTIITTTPTPSPTIRPTTITTSIKVPIPEDTGWPWWFYPIGVFLGFLGWRLLW